MKNVVTDIHPDICVGCGVCVGVCPSHHLAIEYDENNLLHVRELDNKCSDKCNMCLSACPFSNESNNEDVLSQRLYADVPSVSHREECGYYLNCYVGYHPNLERRLESASGGLTTYVLEYLLESHQIDAAMVVGHRKGDKPYYTFTLCRNVDEVRQCTRSAYYAVHAGDALRELVADKQLKSVVIVALPCLCKAIRNACMENAILRRRVKYIIGLVCGQQKTHNFATFLGKKSGIDNIQGIDFRTKKVGRPNGNYGVKLKGREKEKEITFSEYAKEWSFKLFTVQACNYCDDVFAETADMVLMDAWLPEYRYSDKGENLIITRNQELDTIIGSIPGIKTIDVSLVIQSQASVVQNKRSAIVIALQELTSRGIVLRKREILYLKPSFWQRPLLKTKYKISTSSDRMWCEAKGNLSDFYKKIRKYKIALYRGLLLNKIYQIVWEKA